jgi:MFS family permease
MSVGAIVGAGATVSHSVPAVAAGLILLGFGNGMVDVMMNVEGTAVERETGKTLLPLMHAFFSLGTVIGAGLGAAAAALDIAVAWHLSFIAVVLVAVAAIAIRFIPREDALGEETGPKERLAFACAQRCRSGPMGAWS